MALLSQTLVFAGSIHDLLQGNPILGDPADPFYDPAVGIFYWSKFVDQGYTDTTDQKPNGGTVVAQVTGAVKSTGGSEAYASSTSAQNFDYKLSIDMTNVKSTFGTLYGYAQAALNPSLSTDFDASLIDGTFNINVTYDPAKITPPSGVSASSLVLTQNGSPASGIYTVSSASDDGLGNISITVTVDSNATTEQYAIYTFTMPERNVELVYTLNIKEEEPKG